MTDIDFSILQCPITKEGLRLITKSEIIGLLENDTKSLLNIDKLTEGLINESLTYFYPVFEDILLLLPIYALYTGQEEDRRNTMAFDKERVFNYYNQIDYDIRNNLSIYKDSPKWVDFRKVSEEYIRNSFTRATHYLNGNGKYLLDIASGPIGLNEYIDISENYKIRICVDISIKALIQAKHNYSNKKGIFICGDITNIPLKENTCDSVLCQHTLYHVPKQEQKTAVNEMYRVAKPKARIVIVYSLFYHSFFMNITLFPVQLYRIARHLAGKAYVILFRDKSRLYFYAHSINWFRRSFEFGSNIKIYCWRSVNKYFLDLYVHKWLGGRKLLENLRKSEDRHPEFWGRFGEYPVIVIEK